MNSFHLSVLSADEPLYDGPCVSLVVPMQDGQYGIMARHPNMVGAVVHGKLTFQIPDGKRRIAAVDIGIVKVEGDDVLVLLNSGEYYEDIDIKRAKRSAEEAKRIMAEKMSKQEYEAARIDLIRAMNRLRIKKHDDE